MAFLTNKEQSLIRAIKANKSLKAKEKDNMVRSINDNAGLRQHGFRLPVREFVQAMANHSVELLSKRL